MVKGELGSSLTVRVSQVTQHMSDSCSWLGEHALPCLALTSILCAICRGWSLAIDVMIQVRTAPARLNHGRSRTWMRIVSVRKKRSSAADQL